MPLKTVDLNGVEIFSAGTWNGDRFTVADIDEIVSAFNETKDLLKPYAKLGHTNKQKMAQADGLPAMGWVSGLRRVGEKLVADFTQVPAKLADLIGVGAYRRVSSEIFTNITVGGKKFAKALKAVAFLGADTPAVENLNDIIALYAADLVEAAKSYGTAESVLTYEWEEDMKTVEQLTAELEAANARLDKYAKNEGDKIAVLEKQVSDLTSANESLKGENTGLKADVQTFKMKVSDLDGKLATFAREKQEIEVNAQLDKLVKEKKILPAQKEMAFTMLLSAKMSPAEKKYKVGDKEMTAEENVLAFFANNKVDVHTEEDSHAGSRQAGGDALDLKVKEYMEKNKGVGYAEALVAVSPAEAPETKPRE